jgi:hypothetical protein
MAAGSRRRDDLPGVIALIVLLIGTATGNAHAMLALSIGALTLFAVFCRRQLRRGPILVAVLAAVVAALLGVVLTLR